MHGLRSTRPDGEPYRRPESVQAEIEELARSGAGVFIRRCSIEQRGDPDYIPSECLLYFVRNGRCEVAADCYETIFKCLIGRVRKALPSEDGASDTLTTEAIRETALEAFLDFLLADREDYCDRLDYFEIRFDRALVGLRIDAKRKVLRKERLQEPFALDDSDEVGLRLEDVEDRMIPELVDAMQSEDFRRRFRKAIDKLAPNQRETVHMLLQEIPIGPKDADQTTISKALGKSPRMINHYKNEAFEALRKELGGEEGWR